MQQEQKSIAETIINGIGAMFGAPATPFRKVFYQKRVKRCLECGNKHTHNNRWCSATCCKASRAAQ